MTLFGRLTWGAVPFNEPIPLITSLVVILALAGVAAWITKIRGWPYLWNEYITSTDHKRIGIMYIVLALVMLVRGFADAIMMRAQQSLAIGASQGYLPPEHYNQIFSAHGTIMIFFVAMPFVIGFMNFVVPLQLGVRDVAFPTMNKTTTCLQNSTPKRPAFWPGLSAAPRPGSPRGSGLPKRSVAQRAPTDPRWTPSEPSSVNAPFRTPTQGRDGSQQPCCTWPIRSGVRTPGSDTRSRNGR